jgi:dTMP kinase
MPFITFEGVEGSGKTTQLRLLGERFGARVVLTQEPGGTPLGAAIRAILLDRRHHEMTATAELLLYAADRAQHVERVVRPALQEGRTVVSDRYVESTLAYQGLGRGLSEPVIRTLSQIATAGLLPDLIVLLEVPVDVGLGRVGRRGVEDRLEAELREFHERVAAGYRSLAATEPGRWLVLDGTEPPSFLHERIVDEALRRQLLPAEASAVR